MGDAELERPPDGAGEKDAVVEEPEKDDEEALSDLINIDDFLGEEEPPGGAKDTPEKPEKKEAPPADDPEKAELLRKNKELNRALHEERQKRKVATEKEEVVLTDQQVLGLLEEYKDDPRTLLNVIKYQAQQAAKGETKKAVEDEGMKAKKAEADAYLSKSFPGLNEEGSELRAAVDKTKEYIGVKDHPLGDLVGVAVEYLRAGPVLMRQAYEKGVADAKAGKVEEARKGEIKETVLSPKGSPPGKKGEASSADIADVAKRLGLKTPQQIALLKKLRAGNKIRTISVEG